jgi:hypothetical protein
MRQAGFAADKTHSDDEVVWDDDGEDDDAGSSATFEGSCATYDDNESGELEEQGESLSHSSKSPCPSSLRDWSEDDDELEPSAAHGAIALHVAAVAAAGGKISPIVDVPDSLEQPSATPKPSTLETPGGGTATPKKKTQPAPPESAQKRKKTWPVVKDLLPLKAKKVVKCQATTVAG